MTPDRSDEARDLMDRLDRALPPHSDAIYGSDGDDPLVDAARRLAEAPVPGLPDDAVARIEARLQARLAQRPTVPASPFISSRHTVSRFVRLAVAACFVALILGMFGAARASASSLPGDTLYPVKRAIEGGRLALVSDDGEPGLRVELASRRVDEFRQLLSHNDIYPRALEEASEQLWEATRLLNSGAGSRSELQPRITALAQQQSALASQALPAAPPGEQAQLEIVVSDSAALQTTLDSGTQGGTDLAVTEEPAPTATGVPTLPPTSTGTPVIPTTTPLPTATPQPTLTPSATVTPTASPTATHRPVTPTRRPPSEAILPALGATQLPSLEPEPGRFPTLTPPGHQDGAPGNSENAPGHQQDGAPGNSENAPGQQDGAPGNSENAPGQQQDGAPGNSENAPGQQQDGAPGNSENAPGQQGGAPGNSENAPGQNKPDKAPK